MTPKKAVVRLALDQGDVDVQYRVAGQGPALLMLHPSPLNSSFMVAHMRRFSEQVTAIAPDTPGYGRSTALPGEVTDLSPYVDAMQRFCDCLGLDHYAVYGSATGAQIAIELAKADKARVTGVILDNAADFTDAESDQIMDGYFPDIAPCDDGSHLARAWQVAHDSTIFFPWHRRTEAHRIAAEAGPPEAMNVTALGYLEAGPGYEKAYRAAFRNERAERIRGIAAPVTIIRWKASILKPYTDRFDDYSWDSNVRMAHCDATMEARWEGIAQSFPSVLGQDASDSEHLLHENGTTRYVDTAYGQVRYRSRGTSPARLRVHSPGRSIDALEVDQALANEVALDLPGHGESDYPQQLGPEQYLAACAEAVARVAEVCGVEKCEIVGDGASAQLAQHLNQSNGSFAGGRAIDAKAEEALPPFASETGGEHLWRGWYWLRRQFYAQNRPMPDADRLTRMLLDLIRSESAHRHYRGVLEQLP